MELLYFAGETAKLSYQTQIGNVGL